MTSEQRPGDLWQWRRHDGTTVLVLLIARIVIWGHHGHNWTSWNWQAGCEPQAPGLADFSAGSSSGWTLISRAL